MDYYVKRIAGGNYSNAELVIKLGDEVKVTEEQYKYLNQTFGTSGYFTFRTENTQKKKQKAQPKTKKVDETD